MKDWIFNLQRFAEAGTVVNATQNYVNAYTGETESFTPGSTDLSSLNKTFYDTELLDNAREKLIFTQLGRKQALPANHGRTIEFRRWRTLGRISQLTEGVIPTGKKLGQVAITCTLAQYGDYVTVSDLIDLHSIDDVVLGATEELGAAAGETCDLLVRNVLLGGTQIIFADAYTSGSYAATPTTESDLQTKLGTANTVCNVTPTMINKVATQLKKSAKGLKYSGAYYIAIVHPDVAFDLRQDAAWLDAHKYAEPEEIYNGEIGRMHGVRFVESNNAPVIKRSGQTYATYKTIFLCKDAFAVIDAEGGGMRTIIKSAKEIGGPLEQYSTIGCKTEFAAKILYQERMCTLWSGSSYSTTETQNITEDEYTPAA